CLYSKPSTSSPSQVAIEEPSTQELFDAYLESLRNVAKKKTSRDALEQEFADRSQPYSAATSRYATAKRVLNELGREAVRKDENIEALALVQKAKKEVDESHSDLKTHEEGIRQLGPRDWPAYKHMRAIDESAEAYEKFFAK